VSFEEFMADAEPRLRRAFVAALGAHRAYDATAEALAYGWEHWDRVRTMENTLGYLYRVGQSRTRSRRHVLRITTWGAGVVDNVLVEPGLLPALASLSEQQRVAVVLVHGFAWTLSEVAELLDVTKSTVQTHLERGLARLRAALEVTEDA
jgi:RNA polymerase sigma-70 factor (ECF subfamily)